MQFFDTKAQTFVSPSFDKNISMYICGITPYDAAHLGHVFTFMTYDLLARYLMRQGHQVRMVRNITDVDDPLFAKAAELGEDYMHLADREITRLQSTLEALSFLPMHAEPRASEYIDEMAAAVVSMRDSGHAYELEGDWYYDTQKAPGYGGSFGIAPSLLKKLLADRGGDPGRQGKRHPLDFLLWKAVKESGEPCWPSPLGNGRPGWHIECSVMSSALLGSQFDIHGGGNDLLYPHHESEIAQSLALHGHEPARHWLHVAPLMMHGDKMSKSLGNLVFAHDALQKYEPAVLRLALMHYDYRIGGEWQPDLLDSSRELYEQLQSRLAIATQAEIDTLEQAILTDLSRLDTRRIIDTLQSFTQKPTTAAAAQHTGARTLSTLLGMAF